MQSASSGMEVCPQSDSVYEVLDESQELIGRSWSAGYIECLLFCGVTSLDAKLVSVASE